METLFFLDSDLAGVHKNYPGHNLYYNGNYSMFLKFISVIADISLTDPDI